MFDVGPTYKDKDNNEYKFLYKNGGVTVFKDANDILHCRNDKGMYRWDGKSTETDIS